MNKYLLCVLVSFLTACGGGPASVTPPVTATPGIISTFAGTTTGFSGDGAAATAAQFGAGAAGVAADAAGNVYIADTSNHRIRMVPKASGTYFGIVMTASYIYTVVGTGSTAFAGDGAAATAASIYNPGGVAVDAAGNLYIGDTGHSRVRMVPKTSGTYFGIAMTANYIYTVAGNGSTAFAGDGAAATAAQMFFPRGMVVDTTGNLYIADSFNQRIRMVPNATGTYFGISMTANNIYTVAGTGSPGLSGDGAAATAAQMNMPQGLAMDAAGNLYIADSFNNRIRMVPNATGTYFGISMTANNIYTVAGTTTGLSGDGAAATAAQLRTPSGVAVDASGNVCIPDTNNHRVRVVAKFNGTYYGVAMTANNIYTIAGTAIGLSGDGATATTAQLDTPAAAAVDATGNLYVTDTGNFRVRMVTP